MDEARFRTRGWGRKGGKSNRRQQANRMMAFAKFVAAQGVRTSDELGKGHVVAYWRSTRGLSDGTLLNHWYAIRALWGLLGKPGEPPKPRYSKDRELIEEITQMSNNLNELDLLD